MNIDEDIEYINKIIEEDKKTFDEEGYSVISSKMTQAIETVLEEYQKIEKANDRLLVMCADYKINYISKDKIKMLKEKIHRELDTNGITRAYQILIDGYFEELLGE